MDRTKKTVVEILGIILAFCLLVIIVYYAGSGISKTFLKAGEVTHAVWTKHYMGLVRVLGIVTCILTLAWYFFARFFFKITNPFGVGKRTIWVIIGVVNLLACIVVPMLYVHNDTVVKLGAPLYVLFLLLFGVIGYYSCSLLATPASYKYTPIGAEKLWRGMLRKRRTKE
ncbi:MAG: hypothetical protein LKE51_12490 [Selenomonas sp.]|jgi:magnesium-transporting ATPase (P-type)|nr:hypothetical protein [Selenomonas sp.]